ncbi:MAG TPA: glycosyltransferase [Jatrophihabitans sp.]|nr:glycosyltransferase [Jatrophihabitans sp.]
MRIGLIAPPWAEVPPASFGTAETVVDNLARGLRAEGHEVALFCAGSSTCPVPRLSLFSGPRGSATDTAEEAAHVLAAYAALDDFDVIHDHTTLGPLLVGAGGGPQHPQVVVTSHAEVTAAHRRVLAEATRHATVTAVSNSQARQARDVHISAVVHHGVDTARHLPGTGDGGYLLVVGPTSAGTGIHRAIRVARRSHRHLVLLTAMRNDAEQRYYERYVMPALDDDITVLVDPDEETRIDLERGAAALLNTVTTHEPFGLAMAEALAAATPVLSFETGAAPEIVDHARTGYLCRDEDDMAAAVAKLPRLDREACRTAAVTRFSRARMTEQYLGVYDAVLSGSPIRSAVTSTPRLAVPSPVRQGARTHP